MKAISKLKEDARRHEQREEWEKAIQAYLQVLRAADEAEIEVELPLYNRLGDLCVRLGRPQEAVRHYEQAADRYAEAGLYNNAIALCNKALRYSPERLELVRKLGQFSASQGFITDARRYFLEYAERQFKGGKIDDALSALSDFADVSDDADVREQLGRQLNAHGRFNDAVKELNRAHAMRVRDGDLEKAEALRGEIAAIDPSAVPGGDAPLRAPPPAEADAVDELPVLDAGFDEITPAGAEPVVDPFEIDRGALPGDDIEAIALDGLEASAEFDEPAGTESVGDGIEGLETTALDFETVDPGEDFGLAIERPETSFEDPAADPFALREDSFDLPLLGDDDGGSAESVDPEAIPLMGHVDDDGIDLAGSDTGEPTPFTLESATEPAFEVEIPGPGDALDLPPLDLSESVTFDLPSLDDALAGWPEDEATADLPTFEPVAEVPEPGLEEAVEPEPVEIPAIELPTWDLEAVPDEEAPAETAAPDSLTDVLADDEEQELPAWEEPAAPVAGEPGMPDVSVADVAALEEEARRSQREIAASPPPTGFIDLGAFITADDDAEQGTRFRVQETAPTGDEDRDFAELLSQFKSKVQAHLPAEDAAAHYDLGLAFKEMGLVDEAIGEFQVALRAGHMRLKVYEELGQCFLQKEQYNIAEKVLTRALEMKYDDELELLGVYYHLGRAYEALGRRDQARDAYERVLGMDIGFEDVTQRLARL